MSGYRAANAFAWPDDAVKMLVERHRTGETASQIADAISTQFSTPISRCAVIGKIHRIGAHRGPEYAKDSIAATSARRHRQDANARAKLEARERRVTEKEAARLARLKRLQEPLEPEKVAVLPRTYHPDTFAIAPVGIMALTHCCCRWPLHRTAEDGSTLFCANEKAAGSSYCDAHRKRSTAKGRTQAQIDADERRLAARRATMAKRGLTWGGQLGMQMVPAK